jgi:di/tricarboxylate transporter
VYVLFVRRWFPGASADRAAAVGQPRLTDWIEQYNLARREQRVRVTGNSLLARQTLEQARLHDTSGATIVAIERGRSLLQPTPRTELLAGDILLVDFPAADAADARALVQKLALEELPLSGAYFTDRSQEIGMAEAILPADSDLVGRTVGESRLRDRTGLTVIGLRRGRDAIQGDLAGETLRLGDTLLVIGPWRAIENLQAAGKSMVVLNLPAEWKHVLPAAGRAVQAVGCLALVVGLMVSGVIPNVQAALIGCLLMGMLGCVNLQSAYRSIDWKTIVLIVGMLPFSIALQRTGGVELASDALMTMTYGAGAHGVLTAIFAITALLGMFISNTATAVLMAPVALAVAEEIDASPYPFAMIVALAASTAFMTPVSSPVNTLVVTPGNYTFGDFVKIGVPFSIVVMVVCVLLVPLLLPL